MSELFDSLGDWGSWASLASFVAACVGALFASAARDAANSAKAEFKNQLVLIRVSDELPDLVSTFVESRRMSKPDQEVALSKLKAHMKVVAELVPELKDAANHLVSMADDGFDGRKTRELTVAIDRAIEVKEHLKLYREAILEGAKS